MRKAFRKPRSRPGPAEQAARLQARWGANWDIARRGGTITATGRVSPSDLSAEYTVRLDYSDGRQPQVRVIDPPLALYPTATRIPHMYEQERLCLFHPDSGDWTRADFLADTVVPWISQWLLFYEYWLTTGDWLGGGIHPPSTTTSSHSTTAA